MANMTFSANLLPKTDLGFNLGASNQRWNIIGTVNGFTISKDVPADAIFTDTVSTVAWDPTNKKLTKTIDATTSDVMTFSPGANITLITSASGLTIAGKPGTVTSVQVQATSPVVSSTNTAQTSTLNTTISLTDAYGDTKNPYGNKTANYVLAGPASGSAAAPSFRALVAADIPNLSWSKITSDTPTTLAGYGITDATIASGTITLGTNTITPMTNIGLVTGESTAANNGITKTVGTTTSVAITQADLQSAIFIISDTAPADTSVIWLKPVSE